MTRKRIIVISVIIAVVILMVFIFFKRTSGIKTFDLKLVNTSAKIKTSWVVTGPKKDKLLIANNRGFVEYDPVNKSSRMATENTTVLPPTSQHLVSPNGDKLIFFIGNIGNDNLFTFKSEELEEEERSNGSWWIADLVTGKYSYLANDSVSTVGWKNNSTVFYIDKRSNVNTLVEKSLDTEKSTNTIIGDTTDIQYSLSGYVLTSEEGNSVNISLLKPGQSLQQISKGVNSKLFVSPDRTILLFTLGKASNEADLSTGKLVRYNTTTGTSKELGPNIQLNDVAWGKNNDAFFVSNTKLMKYSQDDIYQTDVDLGSRTFKHLDILGGSLILQDSSDSILLANIYNGILPSLDPFTKYSSYQSISSDLINYSGELDSFIVNDVSPQLVDDNRISQEFAKFGIDSNLVDYILESSSNAKVDGLE